MQKQCHDAPHSHEHEHSLYSELICHLPYAIFSVAFGLVIVSFFSFVDATKGSALARHMDGMFHSFHFMHIVFATTGALITFFRFSKNVTKGLVFGLTVPAAFCTLSDAILPYVGGRLAGMHMHLHLCFYSELLNVLPFLLVGVLNGFVIGWYHQSGHRFYSVFSHAIHILISSLASIFYLVSHGFAQWQEHIGVVFLYMVVAVVIPCTLSDVVIPMICAGANTKK